jgi:hypothetical protein
MDPVRRWVCVAANTATSLSVLNGNVEMVKTLVRTVSHFGIRIVAEELAVVNRMVKQF